MSLFDRSRRAFLAGSAAALGIGITGRGAQADQTYPHLENRTVTMMIGVEVGGGFDLAGRVVAHRMESTVPGLKIDVKNVTQASGMLGAKLLQSGPSDGSMLFTCSTSVLNAQIMEEDGVAYDLRQWGWLGKLSGDTWYLFKGPGADFANLDEMRAKKTPTTMSVRSTSSAAYHEALWINAMLGTRLSPVPGYKSTERDSAVFSGEVMTTINSAATGSILTSPEIDVVLRITSGPVAERFRDRPLLADLVKPIYAPIISLIEANAHLSYWYAAPPATDPVILAEWRALFDAVAAQPEFLSDMDKLGIKPDVLTGAGVAEALDKVLADQAETKALLQSLYDCGKALAEGLDNPCGNS